jgi:magnesium transporter
MVKESTEMIDHLSEVFSSVISNNLNNIMKFLTSFSIVLTIPTIIGSFWGMNVDLPIDKSPWAFLIMLGISALISIIVFLWLKRKDYM